MQSNCVESTRHSLKRKKKERAEKGGVGIQNRGTVGNAGTVMSPSPAAHPTTCAKTTSVRRKRTIALHQESAPVVVVLPLPIERITRRFLFPWTPPPTTMASLSLAGLLPATSSVSASRSFLFRPVPCKSPSACPSLQFPSPNSSPIRGRLFWRCAFRRRLDGVASEEEDVEEWDEEEDWEIEEEEEEDDLSSLDLKSMEEEAIDAVRQYSQSLSTELGFEDEVSERKHASEKQKLKKSSSKHIPDHLLPRVTIVGRPNVGKSALFNRLVGGNRAIVVDEPGVTRDRLYGRSFWGDHEFMVVDTGGVMTFSRSQIDVMEELAITTTVGMDGIPLTVREAAVARMPSMIERQATAAVEEAAVLIFLVDGQAGLVAADMEIADWLRKNYSDKCVILAVNKCESPRKGLMQASEFWSLGFSPLPISAISGTGTGELLDLVCSELKAIEKYRLIDTAGIRKRAAVASAGSTTEVLSVNRALRAICRSDVVALVIEAMACITEQDVRIAERIEKEGKGCVIVVNKWDTIPNKNQQTTTYYDQDVREKVRLLDWAPIVYSTAISGHSVDKIIADVGMVEKERSRRLGTSILNQVVQEALAFKPPPRTRGGKRGRVYYSTQAAIRPPTFVFFVNDAKLFPETYRRYMEKQLRKDAGFPGTPIRLLWRSRRRGDKGKAGDTNPSTSSAADKFAAVA
ncbi:uncharacterized protein LOC135608455 isoform X2 [Musa acuminata AAA Group]|uniref:uncharacterized protein LOC135608455 isoform X2 n=1 Tax=Musa acuminata AAA Group TaxID=214697 RepID=UPI0031DD32DA